MSGRAIATPTVFPDQGEAAGLEIPARPEVDLDFEFAFGFSLGHSIDFEISKTLLEQ